MANEDIFIEKSAVLGGLTPLVNVNNEMAESLKNYEYKSNQLETSWEGASSDTHRFISGYFQNMVMTNINKIDNSSVLLEDVVVNRSEIDKEGASALQVE